MARTRGGEARAAALLAAALWLAGPVRGQTVYVAFGDSITEGNVGDDLTREEFGYPPRLEALLAGAGATAEVRNRGKGGEKTYEGVTRINQVLAEGGGQVLLLMEGTNDITRRETVESIVANLGEMARKAEDKGLAVVHATLIPRYPEARNDADNLVNQEVAQEIRHLAGTKGRDLADPFEIFGREADRFDRLYAPAAEDDPVGHPKAAGYDLLADLFFDYLTDRDDVPPVAGIGSPANRAREVPADTEVVLEAWDFGSGLDLAATSLLLNGSPVAASATGDARRVTLRHTPAAALRGVVRVGLRSRDTATPVNAVDREVTRFVVAGTTILAGDFDEDGRVDGEDLIVLARAFGARKNEWRFVAPADANGDGLIDGVDLAQFAVNFGQSSF